MNKKQIKKCVDECSVCLQWLHRLYISGECEKRLNEIIEKHVTNAGKLKSAQMLRKLADELEGKEEKEV